MEDLLLPLLKPDRGIIIYEITIGTLVVPCHMIASWGDLEAPQHLESRVHNGAKEVRMTLQLSWGRIKISIGNHEFPWIPDYLLDFFVNTLMVQGNQVGTTPRKLDRFPIHIWLRRFPKKFERETTRVFSMVTINGGDFEAPDALARTMEIMREWCAMPCYTEATKIIQFSGVPVKHHKALEAIFAARTNI
jgi:hypothetical protein